MEKIIYNNLITYILININFLKTFFFKIQSLLFRFQVLWHSDVCVCVFVWMIVYWATCDHGCLNE